MKNKYKLGTLVETKNSQGDVTHGEITAVISTNTGYYYSINSSSWDEPFPEDAVIKAFRPIGTTRRRKNKDTEKVAA